MGLTELMICKTSTGGLIARPASGLTSHTTSSTTNLQTRTLRFLLATWSSELSSSAYLLSITPIADNDAIYHSDHPLSVLFDFSRGNRAVGVEYLENKTFYPNTSGEILTARATRLVAVTSGPFGSPVLLERSGIGAKDILEKHGVNVLVDLPGVGSQYQGHCCLLDVIYVLIALLLEEAIADSGSGSRSFTQIIKLFSHRTMLLRILILSMESFVITLLMLRVSLVCFMELVFALLMLT